MTININKNITYLLGSMILFAGLNSCVKDRNTLQIDYSQIKPIVEVITNPNTTGGTVGGIDNLVFTPTPDPQEVRIYVNYAAPNVAPSDVTVTLAKDQAALDAYDTANSAALQFLPDSSYTISSLKTTIVKGQRLAYVSLFITPSKIDLSKSYGLAFKIADAQGITISQNGQGVIMPVLVKNKYDGQYLMTILTSGWSAYGIADGVSGVWGTPGNSVGLVTTGANTVKIFDYNYFGAFIQNAFTADGGQTGFGATAPEFAFDLTTDKLISVTNTANPDSRHRAFRKNPTEDSRYDATTQTAYLAYIMSQNGRPDQYIYDTLKYTGSR